MRYLIDTHILLWTSFEPEKLSKEIADIIADPNNIVALSHVSLWEIAIKNNIGRLNLPDTFFDQVLNTGFEAIALSAQHIKEYLTLPLHHRDPFDRMLISQARCKHMTLITKDTKIAQYEVDTLVMA